MLYIYFPGYSAKNIEELESISNHLEQQGHQVWARKWEHWTNDGAEWTPEKYADEALEQINSNSSQEVAIVAKSLGTHVAMRLLSKLSDKSQISQVVLMGIPLNDLDENEKQDYLDQLPHVQDRLKVVQNELDSHASSEEVSQFLGHITFQLLVKPGITDHRYNYPEEII